MVRQEEAETGEDAAEEAAAAGEETSSKVLAIGDCQLRSLLIMIIGDGTTVIITLYVSAEIFEIQKKPGLWTPHYCGHPTIVDTFCPARLVFPINPVY